MTLKYLLEKEFKQLYRNKFMLAVGVLFPLAVILIMPWATTLDIKNIKVTVVDNDQSSLSRKFIDKIEHSTYFHLHSQSNIYNEGLEKVELGEVDLVLEIPIGFENDLINFGTAPIQTSINSVNGIKGMMGQSYINTLAMQFFEKLLAESSFHAESPFFPKMEIIVKNMYNQTLDYKHTMIPGLIMVTIIILCGFLPTVNIVVEKEMGTIEQLNVTPVSRISFILGKLIPFWLIGLVASSFGFFFAWLIYGLLPVGSFLTLYLFACLFILTMSGMGLLVSNHSTTIQQALFVMLFFVIIFILLSGLLTPVGSMPGWAKMIAGVMPTKYIIHAFQSIYLKGSTIGDLWVDLLVLIGMVILFNVSAVISYRKSG